VTVKARVFVRRGRHRPLHGNAELHLLHQLPVEARLRALPQLDLSAGEFPFEGHSHGSAPPGGQDETVPLDDRAGHADMHSLLIS
jgi:diadenosine tetraphosphatase ApaH/serine/threonine PP2A family protein phosphatase